MPLQAARTSPLRTEMTQNTHTHTHTEYSGNVMDTSRLILALHEEAMVFSYILKQLMHHTSIRTNNDNVTIMSTNREDVCKDIEDN